MKYIFSLFLSFFVMVNASAIGVDAYIGTWQSLKSKDRIVVIKKDGVDILMTTYQRDMIDNKIKERKNLLTFKDGKLQFGVLGMTGKILDGGNLLLPQGNEYSKISKSIDAPKIEVKPQSDVSFR